MPVSHAVPESGAAAGEDPALPAAAEVADLVGLFAQASDPRKARGVPHHIAAVLRVTVFALLTGAGNYRTTWPWV